jgi:putative ABC transport system permease protein
MFENYFKIAWRHTLRHKSFSFINVFGLALAMSVVMLIILMLDDQKTYDQFHEKKDRTYRILSKIQRSSTPNASSPFPLALVMREEYPFIEQSTHLVPGVGGDARYQQKAVEMRGYFADDFFFDVFGFELLKGEKSQALGSPNSIVLTSEIATRLFGDEDPIGKTMEFSDRRLRLMQLDFGGDTGATPVSWGTYRVTGVIDAARYKSHLKFDALISSASLPTLYREQKVPDRRDDWQTYSWCYTYVVLRPGAREEVLTTSLNELVERKYAGFEDLKGFRLIPQRLTEITPGIFLGNPTSLHLPIELYYFLGLLALVITVSACVNYTNLSIARALTRAKEIGVRKVNGAKRKNLVMQFLAESVMNALLALALAGAIVILLKPAFMKLWVNQYLSFELRGDFSVYFAFVGLAVFIGLVAGIVPAFHLSGYSPVKALKSSHGDRAGNLGIRKILSASQFVISLFFIITSILIGKQFRHYLTFEYGFDSKNIVNIPLQGNDYEQLSNRFSSIPGVASVSACEFVPAVAMTNGTGVRKDGSKDEYTKFEHLRVDANFLENLGLKLVAGKGLPSDAQADHFVLVNETAVRALGYQYPSDIIGQQLDVGAYDDPVEVIGVMEDFRFQTPVMGERIEPLLFRNQKDHFSYLNVKVASGDLKGTVAKLADDWKIIDPVHPFRYQFFDDQLVKVNQWLGDIVSIIGFIAFLAIVIACLGLLGMAIYTTERRTKEVGIRKVLGAPDLNIAFLLSAQFLKLLLVSILVSAPMSYFINNLWLQNFPNRVEFGFSTVLLGSLVLFVLGLVTIGSQTLRASRKNPLDSLKTE